MAKHEMPAAPQQPVREQKHEKSSPAPRPRNKKARRAIAITLACLIALGGTGGGVYYYLQNRTGKAVDVFPAEQLGTMDAWYDQVNTGGQVRADKMQTVYLSSTQTVTDVFVEEGQQVKVGDKLLAFDTTLDEVELQRKQIAIEQLKLELKDAEEKLAEIDTYKVGTPGGFGPQKTPEPTAAPEPTDVPYFQHGEGTAEDPYVFLWDDGAMLIDGTVDYLLDMAHGFDVPEVTTGPDVPLDPDVPLEPDGTETAGDPGQIPATAAEPGAETAAEPAPVSAGQSYTAPGLLRAALSSWGAHRLLRMEQVTATTEPSEDPEATDTPAPSDGTEATQTPAPSDETAATDTPAPSGEAEATQTPEATEEAEATQTPAPPAPPEPKEPTLPASFEEAILAWFRQMADEGRLAAYYEGMNQAQKQVIANALSDEQMIELIAMLTDAGVAEPSFPERTPEQTPEPSPEPTATPDPSASPEPTPLPVGATYYMVFEIRANNSMQGEILWAFEMQFTLRELEWQRYWGYRVLEASYEPDMSWLPEQEEGGFSWGGGGQYYPAAEIERMRAETQREIATKNIQLKMAEQELKQVQYELSNGEVLCTTDGVVKSVLDPNEALETGEPVVKISGGGGYFITGYMSEFDMQTLHVGDTVTVDNYMSGEELDATIQEISPYPYAGTGYVDYYTQSANENASKYPFTVEVDESANLREGYYVNIYFSATGGQGEDDEADTVSYYLPNAFLRTEGGRSYVYAAGTNDLLEKRYVVTGKSMGGYYTEIKSGVDPETDYLAFPYGRSVKNGAPVVRQEDISVLYDGY